MYSVVLMAALTSADVAPDSCFRRCSCSCSCSCWCGCSCGCGCWCGCNGCHGCYGGWGGWGGYCNCGCYCGGCFSCHGPALLTAPVYGSFCDSYTWMAGYGCNCGWNGCYGCGGCFCACNCGGLPGGPGPEGIPPPKEKKEIKDKEKEQQVRARVIVELPAEAKLFIDGHLMKATSAERVFATPQLQRNKTYFYDLKAEVVRDGQTVAQTQRVYLRAGEVVRANFTELATPAAAAKADE